MKTTYKRKAWLLDNDILFKGYVTKHKFIPDNKNCGFSYQRIRNRDINTILFYDNKNIERGFDIFINGELIDKKTTYNSKRAEEAWSDYLSFTKDKVEYKDYILTNKGKKYINNKEK